MMEVFQITYAPDAQNLTVLIYLQQSRDSISLFDSQLVGIATRGSIVKVNLAEKVLTTNYTLTGEREKQKYPAIFPERLRRARYEQDLCMIILDIIANNTGWIETVKECNFTRTWSRSEWEDAERTNDDKNSQTNHSSYPSPKVPFPTTQSGCPLQYNATSVSFATTSFPAEMFLPLETDSAMVYLVTTSEKLTCKGIHYQKTLQELIAEIGGWLGLLVGASVVTMTEIMAFLVDVIKIMWRWHREAKDVQP